MKRFLLSLLLVLITCGYATATDFNTYHYHPYGYLTTGVNGTTVNDQLTFYSPLTNTAEILTPGRAYPGTSATFTRASAAYLTDFEGVTRKIESGSVGVEGSRAVTNLLTYSEDLSNAAWAKIGTCTVTGTNVVNMPAANDGINQLKTAISSGSNTYTARALISGNGTTVFALRDTTGGLWIIQKTITLTATPQIFSVSGTATAGTGIDVYIRRLNGTTATQATVEYVQVQNVTAASNQNPGEYVKTTTAPVTKCFSTLNGNTVNPTTGVVTEATGAALPQSYSERTNDTLYALNSKIQVAGWWYQCTTGGISSSSPPTFTTGKAGLVTVTDGTVTWTLGGRLLLGYVSEPASTNKTTAYGIIPADTLGSELASGTLTIGQKYQITARTDANFVADGSADNVVGTQFVATAATVTLDAGDKVKRVQWGVGEKSFHNGTSFVNNITRLTLSGATGGVTSIKDGTTLTTNAGLLNISPTGKLYECDNSAGSATSINTFTGTAGNTNKHSGQLYVAKISGSGTTTIEINGTTTTITGTTIQRFKVENVTPLTGSQFVLNVGIGDKVQFLLPQLEELPYATSIMPTAGATSTRAATSLSYPITGNLTTPKWSAKITATPSAASQDGKFFLGSYYDANNSVGLLLSGANAVARKRLASSNNDATKSLTLAVGTTNRFGLRGSLTGWSIFVDSVKGTDSANTATPAAGATLQIGADGNSGNGFTGYFKDLYLYNKPLYDGRF